MTRRRDPRSAGPGAGPRDPRAVMGRPAPGPTPAPAPTAGLPISAPSLSLGPGTTDQEKVKSLEVLVKVLSPIINVFFVCFKAALIMQVLQLSDEQIALLPPDQRQSIMVLKDQIARSSQR